MNRKSAKSSLSGAVRLFLKESRGNATLLTTLAAIPMIACAGMAIDYMRGVRSASDLQQVADAAALAAASARNVTGTTSQQLAQRAAIATNYITASVAKVSDIELIGTPTVTPGPSTIDITVNAKVKGSLINVLNALPHDADTGDGSGGSQAGETSSRDINLSVHSKVAFSKDSYLCLLAMNATQSEAIYFQGNSEFMATCAVQANSNATVAMKTWGSAEAYATSFCARGGWAGSGFEPTPKGGCSYKADPYEAMTLPTAGACANNATGTQVKNATVNLTAGTYCGGLHVKTPGVANLAPGLYIIKNGTLDVDSQSTLNAPSGVVFYLTGTSTYIDIKSGATVTIKAPTTATAIASTIPYKGMAIMQDRLTSVGGTNSVYSKGGVNIEGAFYTPKQKMVVWANGEMNSTSSYFPMIVDTLNMNGTSTLYVNLDYDAAGFAEPTQLKQVGKVFVSQ
jgi:Flp pilus assembly protein TadG